MFVAIQHLLENRHSGHHSFIGLTQFGNDVTDLRNVVSQNDATEYLNESSCVLFSPCVGQEIAKTDCHHDCGGPIEDIDIDLKPGSLEHYNVDCSEPVVLEIDSGHAEKDCGYKVCEEDVEDGDFDKIPQKFCF